MTDKKYDVQVVSPAEAQSLIQKFRASPENLNGRKSIMLSGESGTLVGEFSIVARDANSGEIVWQEEDKNLITDFGRRRWMEQRFQSAYIGFSPSSETPQSGRYTLSSTAAQCFSTSFLVTPANNSSTHTKTFSTTFGVPGVNRTLGTIALSSTTVDGNLGIRGVLAYSLLTPPKVQTTTQTLEVVYKVSMNPIS